MAPSGVGLGGKVDGGPTSRAIDAPSEAREGAACLGGSVWEGRGLAVVGVPQWFSCSACFHYASTAVVQTQNTTRRWRVTY